MLVLALALVTQAQLWLLPSNPPGADHHHHRLYADPAVSGAVHHHLGPAGTDHDLCLSAAGPGLYHAAAAGAAKWDNLSADDLAHGKYSIHSAAGLGHHTSAAAASADTAYADLPAAAVAEWGTPWPNGLAAHKCDKELSVESAAPVQ